MFVVYIVRKIKVYVQNSICVEDWLNKLQENTSIYAVIYLYLSAEGEQLFSVDG